jgi:hypothetical protein
MSKLAERLKRDDFEIDQTRSLESLEVCMPDLELAVKDLETASAELLQLQTLAMANTRDQSSYELSLSFTDDCVHSLKEEANALLANVEEGDSRKISFLLNHQIHQLKVPTTKVTP